MVRARAGVFGVAPVFAAATHIHSPTASSAAVTDFQRTKPLCGTRGVRVQARVHGSGYNPPFHFSEGARPLGQPRMWCLLPLGADLAGYQVAWEMTSNAFLGELEKLFLIVARPT